MLSVYIIWCLLCYHHDLNQIQRRKGTYKLQKKKKKKNRKRSRQEKYTEMSVVLWVNTERPPLRNTFLTGSWHRIWGAVVLGGAKRGEFHTRRWHKDRIGRIKISQSGPERVQCKIKTIWKLEYVLFGLCKQWDLFFSREKKQIWMQITQSALVLALTA